MKCGFFKFPAMLHMYSNVSDSQDYRSGAKPYNFTIYANQKESKYRQCGSCKRNPQEAAIEIG